MRQTRLYESPDGILGACPVAQLAGDLVQAPGPRFAEQYAVEHCTIDVLLREAIRGRRVSFTLILHGSYTSCVTPPGQLALSPAALVVCGSGQPTI
jgi:hypothetical protein